MGATVWGQRCGQRCGSIGLGGSGAGTTGQGHQCGGNGVGETVKNRMLCLIAKHYSVPAFYYKLVYYKFFYFQAFQKFVFVTFKLLKIEKMAPLAK